MIVNIMQSLAILLLGGVIFNIYRAIRANNHAIKLLFDSIESHNRAFVALSGIKLPEEEENELI